MIKAVIKAIDICEPDFFLRTSEIEEQLACVYERLKLPLGRLELQTNIISRGIFNKDTAPSTIASNAAKNLFKNNSIETNDIDLLIYSGVCRDQLEPSTASRVHHLLNLKDTCQSFDLSNACLGFVNAINMAKTFIENNSFKKILITTGENSTSLIKNSINELKTNLNLNRKSIKPMMANFSIGSAGVACLIEKGQGLKEEIFELIETKALSNTEFYNLCIGGGDTESLFMSTDSEKLLEVGVDLAKRTFNTLFEKINIKKNQIKKVICHQVGIMHQRMLLGALLINPELDFSTFPEYGNTGSAALPLTLHKYIKSVDYKELKKDDYVLLMGIGSGVHCQMSLIRKL